MEIQLSFFGAARNVTGSKYLVAANGTRLLVDCGMYQERKLKPRNWERFPFDPTSIDAVLMTHAHLDHCGLLPKLVREGFNGSIVCTSATADIAKIVLMDSARIQEEDVKYKRKRHEREGRGSPYPYEPLYTVAEAEAACTMFSVVKYGEATALGDGVTCTWQDAGHILGSAMLHLAVEQNGEARRIVFSGDVGRCNTPILRDPSNIGEADYVVIESTYGNRHHKPNDRIPETLAKLIAETHGAGGNIVVPSFSVERAQELLYHLHELLREKRIPALPVYLDSPMAARVTDVFREHPELFDEETKEMLRRGEHPCDFARLHVCRTVDESKAIQKAKGSAVIIAGSGMCTGGRIKHHLKANISRPESAVLFVGYQASGTLGRIILQGVDNVRIHGRKFPVAARVAKINGFSAHADMDELLEWLSGLADPPRHVFVTHGEPEAATGFGDTIRSEKGWQTSVPSYRDSAELG